MCLPALLIEGLSPDEKTVLILKRTGQGFGTGTARVQILNALVKLKLARRMGYSDYGHPSWVLTPCGMRAGQMLADKRANPLLAAIIEDEYDEEIRNWSH